MPQPPFASFLQTLEDYSVFVVSLYLVGSIFDKSLLKWCSINLQLPLPYSVNLYIFTRFIEDIMPSADATAEVTLLLEQWDRNYGEAELATVVHRQTVSDSELSLVAILTK